MKNLLCFVLTTPKYEDRIKRIENTWAKNLNTIFYSNHQDITRNILKVTDEDSYQSAALKQINIINVLPSLTKDGVSILDIYDWLLFCDDDTFVNSKVIKEEIEYCNELCAYGNVFNKQKHPTNPIHDNPHIPNNFEYLSGGAGFLLSTRLLKSLGKFKYYGTHYGDVEVGLNLHFKKVNLIDHPKFNAYDPNHRKHTENDIKNSATYHYINTDYDMYTLYNMCN